MLLKKFERSAYDNSIFELIKKILNRKDLNIYIKDKAGLTVGEIASKFSETNKNYFCVHEILYLIRNKLITELCKVRNINLESQKTKLKKLISTLNSDQIIDHNCNSPLHMAINNQNPEIAIWLFYLRPELININNNLGQTPIELAMGHGEVFYEFIKKLISLGRLKNAI